MTYSLEDLTQARILLVDDDEDVRDTVKRSLRKNGYYDVTTTDDIKQVLDLYLRLRPDLVLLDYKIPPTTGLELMELFRSCDIDGVHPPIIMLTGAEDARIKKAALEAGVTDFVDKSFDHTELVLRVRNALRTHQLHLQLHQQKTWLEETIRIRTQDLRVARREIFERLSRAIEFRDDATGDHTRRVGRLSRLVAESLGSPPEYAEAIETAALLHDIGKIGIPDAILHKPGPLTPDERRLMETHTTVGAQMLEGSSSPILEMAEEIALTHHERWDGAGYPRGLSGTDIPLSGRIVGVVDAYDAMTQERPYRGAMGHDEAVAELVSGKGHQFDPKVVDAFLISVRGMHAVGRPVFQDLPSLLRNETAKLAK
jgi:putative two-component system response regulator